MKTLDDGRMFPTYGDDVLSWSIGLYMTLAEARQGYPRARAVIQAMMIHRPEELERERRDMIKGSFDRVFGHNAKECLRVIESEITPA